MRFVWKLVLLAVHFSIAVVLGQFRLPQYDEKSPSPFKKLNIVITGMALCKGPKRHECGADDLAHKPGDFNNPSFTFKFDKPVTFQRFKIAIWFLNNGTTVMAGHAPDMLRWIDNPCNHFFLKTVLQGFDVSPSCTAKKGVYKFSFDMRPMFYDFFGFKYNYGNYQVHTLMLEKNCNIVCTWTSFALLDNRHGKESGAKNLSTSD